MVGFCIFVVHNQNWDFMKRIKYFILLSFVVVLLFSSCGNNNKKEQSCTQLEKRVSEDQLYVYVEGRDTVKFELNISEESIEGRLDFLPYETGSRVGTLHSISFQGDTLFAIYHSMQEGMLSDCEVALLKGNDTYILSHDMFGERNYTYNADFSRGAFRDKKAISFADGLLLTRLK